MKRLISLIIVLIWFSASNAWSQSMMVIGGGFAVDCFHASELAAKHFSASFSDIKTCDKAIAQDTLGKTDLASTYINRGIIYAQLSKYDRAQKDYEKAMELLPGLAEAYLNRGNLYFLTGMFDPAIRDYDKALSLDLRMDYAGVLNRGMAYELSGNLERAKQEYLHSLELLPNWELALSKLERIEGKMAALTEAVAEGVVAEGVEQNQGTN